MSLYYYFLGRLGPDKLPFWDALTHPTLDNIVNDVIATGAASMVIIGAVVTFALITWYGKWKVLWSEWLTSVDHKRIGIMYIVLAFVMLARAVIEAALMRTQQSFGLNGGFLSWHHFGELFIDPRHDHDLLHGDAVSHRGHQLRDAAANRRARRFLPGDELDQSRADGGGRRDRHDFPGDRQVFDRRLERLSALYRDGFQSGRRPRLLDLGRLAVLARVDDDRHQLRRHHLQEAGARHAFHSACRSSPGRRCAPAS